VTPVPLALLPRRPVRTVLRVLRPMEGARANAAEARHRDTSLARARSAAAVEQAHALGPQTWVPLQREAPSRGTHGVDLPENEAQQQARLCDYVLDGLAAGETVVVVATPPHVRALRQRLALSGLHPGDDRLVVRDAERALQAQLGTTGPSYDRFVRVAGGDLRRLLARGRPVRAYGETCDLLLARGDRATAEVVEQHWDRLLRELPVSVLCAYSADHDDLPGLVGPTHTHRA